MRNKILLISEERLEIVGGGPKFIISFCKNLKNKGYDVEIIDFDLIDDKIYPYMNIKEELKRITLFKIGKRGFFSLFSFPLNIFKFIKTINSNKVIYTISKSLIELTILVFYSIFGKKIIFGYHNPAFLKNLSNFPSFLYEIYLFPYKLIFKFITLHALNDSDKLFLLRTLKPRKIIVIPNFIILPKVSHEIKYSREFNVLFVGRLDKYQKGLDLLAKIIEEINKRTDKINFWIVGDGKDRNIVEEIAKKYKNVKYFGKVSDEKLIEIYKNSSLLIITSRFETFHLVSIEAQYFGIPVIAFNIDVFKERKYIFKVKLFNIKSFANKILEIYKLWKENKEKYLELRRKIKEHSKIYTFDYIYEKYWKNILES